MKEGTWGSASRLVGVVWAADEHPTFRPGRFDCVSAAARNLPRNQTFPATSREGIAMTPDGLRSFRSDFGPKETMDRLATSIARHGITILARIIHERMRHEPQKR